MVRLRTNFLTGTIMIGITGMLIGFASCERKVPQTIYWNEKGLNNRMEIKPGIAAEEAVTVEYKRKDSSSLKIELKAPVVISVADKPEGWGFFQFPKIYNGLDEHTLIAQWNMQPDAIESYGKPGRDTAISTDGGKTWMKAPAGTVARGLILPGGEMIEIYRPAALKEDELKLPAPVGQSPVAINAKSHPFTFYHLMSLPNTLQGVYLNRLYEGERSWHREHAALIDSQAVRYSRGGLFPVVWMGDMHVAADGFIIAGIYPAFTQDQQGKVDVSGITFYRSTDKGHSWTVQGRIPYQPDTTKDLNGNKRLALGFTEPGFEILKDGSFLCIMRTTDGLGNSPMYASRSTDLGVTWSKPRIITPFGVLPRVLQLKNGVIVLSAGRPGVQLRFSADPQGMNWTDPLEMLPYEGERPAVTCGYTGLLATGPDRFLLIYSDFKFLNEQKEERKAIKIREVIVTPYPAKTR